LKFFRYVPRSATLLVGGAFAAVSLCLTSAFSNQERLYYASLKAPPPSHNILASTPKRGAKASDKAASASSSAPKKQIHFFNIDNELVYWNFFLDFGPLNLGQLTRFCEKLNDKLAKFPVVCFYSSCIPAKRANAIWLICAYQLLHLDRSPEDAWAGFEGFLPKHREMDDAVDGSRMSLPPVSQSQGAVTIAPLPPWHDASPCACTYDLTVFDCLKGFQKARMHGFYDSESFDVEEYEHFEQVEVRRKARRNVCCYGSSVSHCRMRRLLLRNR
jgi:Dual specificity protein phosphatase, N-terminal half